MIEENKNYYNNVAPIFRSQSDKSYKGNYLAYSSDRVNKFNEIFFVKNIQNLRAHIRKILD